MRMNLRMSTCDTEHPIRRANTSRICWNVVSLWKAMGGKAMLWLYEECIDSSISVNVGKDIKGASPI
jgi:hypothetical protein